MQQSVTEEGRRFLAKLLSKLPEARRPKLVCVNGEVVAEAVVVVSPKDRNWWRSQNGEVRVAPPPRVQFVRRV
jgi:hypothetical protein